MYFFSLFYYRWEITRFKIFNIRMIIRIFITSYFDLNITVECVASFLMCFLGSSMKFGCHICKTTNLFGSFLIFLYYVVNKEVMFFLFVCGFIMISKDYPIQVVCSLFCSITLFNEIPLSLYSPRKNLLPIWQNLLIPDRLISDSNYIYYKRCKTIFYRRSQCH